jgi:hypothetical protein
MATVPTHSSIVKGAAASPGGIMPARTSQPVPAMPAQALEIPKAVNAASSKKPESKVVTAVMQAHYRDALNDSKADASPVWRDAKAAMRLLKHMAPLIMGVIQRPGSSADIKERKEAVDFLISSTDALAKVMTERLAPNQDIAEYDRLNLTATLTHTIGSMWEKSAKDLDPQKKIDELLVSVSALYSDEAFLLRRTALTQDLMTLVDYLKVDSPEVMEDRLRQSMHLATMRLFESTGDDRLSNGKQFYFTYGLSRVELVDRMAKSFEAAAVTLLQARSFSPSLSNDMRTSIAQSWIRNASEIYCSEYVARTMRLMDHFKEGSKVSNSEFKARFAQAKAMIEDVLDKASAVTTETMKDLIAVANAHGEMEYAPHKEPSEMAPR